MIRFIVFIFFIFISANLYAVDLNHDSEFFNAFIRMRSEGMTKYQDIETYNPVNTLTREQAAKFFVGLANIFSSGSSNIS